VRLRRRAALLASHVVLLRKRRSDGDVMRLARWGRNTVYSAFAFRTFAGAVA